MLGYHRIPQRGGGGKGCCVSIVCRQGDIKSFLIEKLYNIRVIQENDVQKFSLTAQFAKHAQDFDDLQNEMAGRDVGRISRFLNADARDAKSDDKRRSERETALTNLQIMMMNDPAYAALYRDTARTLHETQTFLDQSLEQVQAAKLETQAAMADALDKAARLPDGTQVFKDREGQVRQTDGSIVLDALVASIVWNGTEPTFEEMRTNKNRADGLDELESDILAGQVEIGAMQGRMDDQENPVSAEELDRFKDRAQEIEAGIEESMKPFSGQTLSSEQAVTQSNIAGVEVPKF